MARALAKPKLGGPGVVRLAVDHLGHVTPHDGGCIALTPPERRFLEEGLEALTAREREVVYALLDAADRPNARSSNAGLADRLCVAEPTLRTHLMRINQKLGTASKSDLLRLVSLRLLQGYRRGELSPRSSDRPASPHADHER